MADRDILALDVGTTAFKMGVFSPTLEKRAEASRRYDANVYDRGKADIEPWKWWQALSECCAEDAPHLGNIGVISFSVTTPGCCRWMPPAYRSPPRSCSSTAGPTSRPGKFAPWWARTVPAGDLQSAGLGRRSSLCSILWIRENHPEAWRLAAKFGHTNTYMVRRFTGNWAIDPSTVSITGLYNSARHDLTWNQEVLAGGRHCRRQTPTAAEFL